MVSKKEPNSINVSLSPKLIRIIEKFKKDGIILNRSGLIRVLLEQHLQEKYPKEWKKHYAEVHKDKK